MATGMTTITYGPALSLVNVQTRQFSQEVVFDDSGTDAWFFKYTIRVIGYINQRTSQAGFGVLPTTGGLGSDGRPSAADQINGIRNLLATRQQFKMTIGNYTVLSAAPAIVVGSTSISGKDCNNGPKAKVLSVEHIAGDETFRIEVEFEICQVQCDSSGGTSNTSGVLSNRWSMVDDVDADFYTTRTISGRLRCASSQVNPNSFRWLVVPPLQSGMRRESMQFRVTEDALNLEYTIVDREIAFSAPAPATSWSLRVTERRDLETLFWFVDVDVMLKGDRNVDKKKLIAIASAIADVKFGAGNPGANNFLVQSISISDEYSNTENTIHFSATAKRLDNNGPAIKGMQAANLGRPITGADLAAAGVNNYDSTKSRDGRNGEKLEVSGPIPVVGAFACFLQNPCDGNHAITQGTSGPVSQSDPAAGSLPAITAAVVTELADDNSLANYDAANYTNAYTYWQLDSQYFTTQNRAHCPIAQTSGGSSSSNQNTSVVVNLAPPMTKRIIRVVAERIGIAPTIPAPVDSYTDPSGATAILLENNLIPSAPIRSPDNKQVFRVAGEITYGLLKAINNGSTISLGFNSWESQTPTYKLIFPEKAET